MREVCFNCLKIFLFRRTLSRKTGRLPLLRVFGEIHDQFDIPYANQDTGALRSEHRS